MMDTARRQNMNDIAKLPYSCYRVLHKRVVALRPCNRRIKAQSIVVSHICASSRIKLQVQHTPKVCQPTVA